MMVVVPPATPAAVPVKKSSELTVPMKGISMWVCASMPPGKTYWPDASTTSVPAGTSRSLPMALMTPPSQKRSAVYASLAVTTFPFLMMRAMRASYRAWARGWASSGDALRERTRGGRVQRCVMG